MTPGHWPWTTFAGQPDRGCPARLLHRVAAGAPRAIRSQARLPGDGLLRCAQHLLDVDDRAPRHARSIAMGARRRATRRRASLGGLAAVALGGALAGRRARMSFLALWLAVGVLGGVGSIARFLLHSLFSGGARADPARHPRGQPVGISPAGRAGRRLAGWRRLPARRHRDARLLHDVLDLDARVLAFGRARPLRAARANVLVSLLLGLVAVALGRLVGEAL